jgi:cyclopropane-fatty-acyl-phospholipid synthase
MWNWLLDQMLRGFVTRGTLIVSFPDGAEHRYGSGEGPPIHVHLRDPKLPSRIVTQTDVALGEAYMNGSMTLAQDDLNSFLDLIIRNVLPSQRLWWRRAISKTRHLRRTFDQWNPRARARANVAHHYDLSGQLYDLFLDEDQQYSCAYFLHPNISLAEAQTAKKAHIAAKLRLEKGMEVFEIGCGWGGLALSLARDYDVRVFGVTLSEEQHKFATARAEAEGLSDRVQFGLMDYREVTGTYDRIVSIGMFEHVGAPHFKEYFGHVQDRLKDDGIALIHTIGRAGPPCHTSPWITKYIFPGGYVPALSEMTTAIEKIGLYPTDIEVWRLHYAETLRHWYDRFCDRQQEAEALYDPEFVRMWRYYLKVSEMTFRHANQCVFQVQLAKDQAAVPLTRDYLYTDAQQALRAAE